MQGIPRERIRRRWASKVVTVTAAEVSKAVSAERSAATPKASNTICTEVAAGTLAVDKAYHGAAAAAINRAVSATVDAAAAAIHAVFARDVSSAATVGDGEAVFAYVDADAAAEDIVCDT